MARGGPGGQAGGDHGWIRRGGILTFSKVVLAAPHSGNANSGRTTAAVAVAAPDLGMVERGQPVTNGAQGQSCGKIPCN